MSQTLAPHPRPRLLDEKGQNLFEDAETDQMVREAFSHSFFAGATTVSDFVLGFRLGTSKACVNEAEVTKFARAFKASKLYCPASVKTVEELKTTQFVTPELVKAVEEGQATERAQKRRAGKKRAAADPHKRVVAAAKARAVADLAKMQSGKW